MAILSLLFLYTTKSKEYKPNHLVHNNYKHFISCTTTTIIISCTTTSHLQMTDCHKCTRKIMS